MGEAYVCGRCGLSSSFAEVFATDRGNRDHPGLCLACLRRRARRASWWTTLPLLALPLGLALIVLVRNGQLGLAWSDPVWFASLMASLYRQTIGGLLAGAPVFLAAALGGIVAHEAGHALAARLNGMVLNEVSVGHGPRLASATVGRTRFVLRLLPVGGHTMMFPTSGLSRGRQASMVAAGPAMDAVVLATVLAAGTPGAFGRALAIMSAIGLVANLLPCTSRGRASDGLLLRRLLEDEHDATGDDAGDLALSQQYAQAAASHRDGRLDEARRSCELVLAGHPDDSAAAALLAAVMIEQGRPREARRRLHALLGADVPEPRRALCLSNLAWADLLLDDPRLLPEALDASREALAALPSEPAVRNTRGYALILSGRIEEGLMLVAEALTGTVDRPQRATMLAVQTVGQARLGRLREASASLQRARRMNRGDLLLPRAAREVARCGQILEEASGHRLPG